jgi:hypothetical protein
MKYFVRTVIGLGLLIGSLVAISVTVYNLLGIGTCASGGPYAVARECPEGTEWLGLLIPGGIFVMLGSALLYATRGAPPGSEKKGGAGSALLLIWSGLFLGIGFACFWGVWGPDANPGPGGKEGGLIVGFLFVPMGLAPIVATLWSRRKRRQLGWPPAQGGEDVMLALERRAPVVRKSNLFGDGDDKLSKLERIEKLRSQGALTRSEFDRLKAEVMGE